MNTWGTKTLFITGFRATDQPISLREQSVISDPTNPSAVNTILQGIGTSRTIYDIEGYCIVSELTNLLDDKVGYVKRTLVIEVDSDILLSKTCLIEKLDYRVELKQNKVFYSMTLIES